MKELILAIIGPLVVLAAGFLLEKESAKKDLLAELSIIEKEFADNLSFSGIIKEILIAKMKRHYKEMTTTLKTDKVSFYEKIYIWILNDAKRLISDRCFDSNGRLNIVGMDLLDIIVKTTGLLAQVKGLPTEFVDAQKAAVREDTLRRASKAAMLDQISYETFSPALEKQIPMKEAPCGSEVALDVHMKEQQK